ERVYQIAAVLAIVEEHDRIAAARLRIGREQGAQAAQQRVGRRERIGRRAGGAGGGALPAARADLCIDRDVIAGRRNRARRAEIETAPAADDVRAAVSAEVG